MKLCVGFSRPKSWMPYSWLIMAGYGINYDHVYVVLPTALGTLVFQASGSQVNFVTEATMRATHVVVDEFQVEFQDAQLQKLITFAVNSLGKPYGYLEAVGLGLVRLCSFVGIKINNPFQDNDASFVCSELIAYVLETFDGVQLGDTYDVNPKTLHDYLTLHADKVQ